MALEEGLLQAYLDDELPAIERSRIAEHLDACERCRDRLAELQRGNEFAAGMLAALDPLPVEMPATAPALKSLRAGLGSARPARWTVVTRSVETMIRGFRSNASWRLAAVGGLALVLVIATFSIAPVRDAMAQFLGIFRVQKFSVIDISQDRARQLEDLGDMVEQGVFGEPETLREAGKPQVVGGLDEAQALAGFAARTPMDGPEGATLGEVSVQEGPHLRMTVERSAVEAALAFMGVTDVSLPPLDRVTVEVDVPPAIAQRFDVDNPYGSRDAAYTLVQAPSPVVDVPAGIDPQAMGEILLQVLGLQPNEARQLAATMDWTSTFIIPLPSDMVRSYDLDADGVPAVLLEQKAGSDGYRRQRLLLWQRDGMVYALEAENLAAASLKQIADSLQ
jgi:hypothetical protein